MKLGAKGSVLFVEGEEEIWQPIIEASKVIDTTGAGDTFTAAFAVALVEGKTRNECLKFAGDDHVFIFFIYYQFKLIITDSQFTAAAASLCVQVKGAIPSMPERDSVIKLLLCHS